MCWPEHAHGIKIEGHWSILSNFDFLENVEKISEKSIKY